jgi:hypothetical protein
MPAYLAAFLSEHTIGDIGFYICFLAGQFLFMLKRAASCVRNPANTIKTRRQFFYVNWDVLSIRAAIESLVIYYPWRHLGIGMILGFFNIDTSAGWLHTLLGTGVGAGPIAAIALGYGADSGLDAISQYKRVPDWLQRWIKENIPPAPTITWNID